MEPSLLWINVAFTTVGLVLICSTTSAQDDFSGPIKCYYCYGEAENSSCADPVNPRKEKGKSLEVIECEHGVCLKWTHNWGKNMYMHRTCSARMTSFKIMMIDGVCRSERTGNGYLCMCGKHLCNSARHLEPYTFLCMCVIVAILYLQKLKFHWTS